MEGKVRILNLFLLILGSIAKSGHVVIETINYWATIDIIYIATKNGDIKQQSMGIKGTDSPGFLIETDRWKFTCDAGKNLRKAAITSGWVDQPFKGVDGGDNHLVFTGKDKAGNHLWIGTVHQFSIVMLTCQRITIIYSLCHCIIDNHSKSY